MGQRSVQCHFFLMIDCCSIALFSVRWTTNIYLCILNLRNVPHYPFSNLPKCPCWVKVPNSLFLTKRWLLFRRSMLLTHKRTYRCVFALLSNGQGQDGDLRVYSIALNWCTEDKTEMVHIFTSLSNGLIRVVNNCLPEKYGGYNFVQSNIMITGHYGRI